MSRPAPRCPLCNGGDCLPAVAEESPAESPPLVVGAGLLVVAAGLVAATALLLSGQFAWIVSATLLLALWRRAATRPPPAPAPTRWYCPDCERVFPG